MSLLLDISSLIDLILKRIVLGFLTLPAFTDWLNAIILIVAYAAIALPLGLRANFLQLDFDFSRKIAIRIITTSLIAPAILEELFFRVILLPHSLENASLDRVFFYSLISLLCFVVYHPLNAITFFPAGRETFFNPIFWFLATLLGLICTIAYVQSGSIWIPVIIHWLIVVIWLLCLGGIKKLKILESAI